MFNVELPQDVTEIIDPNGKLETKPWGMKEFAILDPAGVCITFCESANNNHD
ncbi:MAG: hypothetical protein QNJ18_06365 [Xenococcaceae cyanobacterium MO_167.B52]|nr:hypothetical protein [Xenococcaceae cyanobacterium MO_167.B52]